MLKTCMAMQVHCAMFFTFNLLLKTCTCFLGLLKNCTRAPICERLARRQPRIGVNDSAMVSKLIEPDPSRNCCTCIQTLIWYILTCLRDSARNVHTSHSSMQPLVVHITCLRWKWCSPKVASVNNVHYATSCSALCFRNSGTMFLFLMS